MRESPPVSILILTLNEERNLPACLAALTAFDDIVVLDSGSTDRTAEIALAAGARVFVNPFRDFAQQRNHAHEHIAFKHPWVLHLDADEILLPELAAACARLDAKVPFDGYYVAPRMMFHGRWLRRCTDFPAWQARCVRARGFRFIQAGHGQREAPDMRMDFLEGNYLHDISVADETEWAARHRRYARAEAAEFLTMAESTQRTLWQLFTGPMLVRRRALKRLSYSLPARPLLRFLYQYVLRGGWLDGAGAWRYCALMARYEGFITDAIRELESAAKHG